MAPPRTVFALLSAAHTDAPVLTGDGVSLNQGELLDRVDALARWMAGAGAGRHDRIALVTRNGPEAALAFIAASIAGVAAPLNPSYTRAEFEFSLRDLPARLLVTDGLSPAASEAANSCGIPEIRLSAGAPGPGPSLPFEPPSPADVALVLHTSGTTGIPKRGPLTHANLTASAANIASTLGLAPGDRCLNVMPLFHIHGLIGAVLASLHAGSEVFCTPGFDAFQFWRRVEEVRPTWYSAVPSMHQAILSRAPDRPPASLRFVRSASSSLAPVLIAELEANLGVPVIEAYGMTEAAHQVASNPLPPGQRRPGSVGLPAGVEVQVFAPDGQAVVAGTRGEVCIRGASVTAGYEGIDPATTTFPGGWLRTGDEGLLDDAGYLWLTGRIKELINRGGEKVSPVEVEAVLLEHPAVAQVVVFALPHPSLGQEVAAALVPVDKAAGVAVADLRRFASERLAPFKVPRKFVVLDAIPLGPTGKPQRSSMAERLGLA